MNDLSDLKFVEEQLFSRYVFMVSIARIWDTVLCTHFFLFGMTLELTSLTFTII